MNISKPTSEDEIVCHCENITAVEIKAAIDKGADNLEKISASTGACSSCGGCKPYIEEMLGISHWLPVKVTATEQVSKNAYSYTLEREDGKQWTNIIPGQYALLQGLIDGKWNGRPYAFSGDCHNHNEQQVTVKLKPDGIFSNWLLENHDNSDIRLRVSPPLGNGIIHPQEKLRENFVFFAAGIGITPILCLLRTFSKAEHAKIHLDYSVTFDKEHICKAEFKKFRKSGKNISIRFRTTSKEGRFGQQDIRDLLPEHAGSRFFISGSRSYQENIKKYLLAENIPESKVLLLDANERRKRERRKNERRKSVLFSRLFFLCGNDRRCAQRRQMDRRASGAAVKPLIVNENPIPQNRLPVPQNATANQERDKSLIQLGVFLFALYLLQEIFQIKIPALEDLQTDETYKRWSGGFVFLCMLYQWKLPFYRWMNPEKIISQNETASHKTTGVLSPLIYYVHSTSIGYGYLAFLSIAYLSNTALGLLNSRQKSAGNRALSDLWLVGHIVLSLILFALIPYHIYIAFAYN